MHRAQGHVCYMRYREDVGLPASQRFRQCGLRFHPRIDASFRNVPDRPGSAVPPGGRCEQSWGALGELVFKKCSHIRPDQALTLSPPVPETI